MLLLVGYCGFVVAAWWLFTHRIDRFLVPALPFAALLAGAGAARLQGPIGWCAAALFVGGVVASFPVCTTADFLMERARPGQESDIREPFGDNRYFLSLETLRLDEPATPGFAPRMHPAHRYLNRHITAGQRALLVGDAQPFDLEVPILYNTCFDDCLFEQFLRGKSRRERLATLREHGISHIYIAWSEIARYRSRGNYGFTDYVTRELVHDELVGQQRLLTPVDIGLPPEIGEMFEVNNSER
jgi:hypothetical protein